jgi:tetratricopeptide (TPR) repeat protein
MRAAVACAALLLFAVGFASAYEQFDSLDDEFLIAEGIEAYNRGDFGDAIEAFTSDEVADRVVSQYYAGLASLAAERPTLAVDFLEQAAATGKAPSQTLLNLGIAHLLEGDSEAALSRLEDYQQTAEDDRFARFFSAIALRRLGRDSEATQEFQIAAADQRLRPLAQGYLNAAANAPLTAPGTYRPARASDQPPAAPSRSWDLAVITGVQYDSNVTLSPEFVGLGSNNLQEDASAITGLFGDVRLLETDTWNVGLVTSMFGSFYNEVENFDAQNFMGGVYSNRLIAPNLMASIRYEFHETLLDYNHFAGQHRIAPSLTYLMGTFGHVTTYYEAEFIDFNEVPLIPALDLDSKVNAVGVTQAIYTAGLDGRLFFGYRFEEANADGDDFDRQTHMLSGRIEQPFTSRLIADAEYRIFWDDYDDPNSLDFDGRIRFDKRQEVRAGLQFACTPNQSLRLDYTYIDSDSNVANLFDVRFFEYDRHLVSLQYIFEF